MKILINTISTKKYAGGAFQISRNFMLRSLEDEDVEWYYITSQDVDDAIGEKFAHLKGTKYFVFPTQPDFRGSYRRVKKELAELEVMINPDVVYSVTAPSYFTFKTKEVMRFTNPWVTHPNKYAWSVLSFKEKVYYFLYGLNQRRMMRAAHYFITQTETCAKGICRVTGESSTHVKVVSNVLPAIFNQLDNSPIRENEYINIACVGAATPHKNFDLIPDVLLAFKQQGYNNVRIHMTLPKEEPVFTVIQKKLNRYGIYEMLVNHGRLDQKSLGEMYRRCQFCYLPTLLEVFSASTVEAMYYGLPIVATNFDFNSDILEDSCLYYEPKNANDAVRQFVRLISNENLQYECKKKMQKLLLKYGNYESHFNAIKRFLIENINNI